MLWHRSSRQVQIQLPQLLCINVARFFFFYKGFIKGIYMAIRCVNIYSDLGTTFFLFLFLDSHMKKCLKYKILKEKKVVKFIPNHEECPIIPYAQSINYEAVLRFWPNP